jgi:hypothetical protein
MSNFEVISALDIQNSLFVINFFLFLFLNLMASGLSHGPVSVSIANAGGRWYLYSRSFKHPLRLSVKTHPNKKAPRKYPERFNIFSKLIVTLCQLFIQFAGQNRFWNRADLLVDNFAVFKV